MQLHHQGFQEAELTAHPLLNPRSLENLTVVVRRLLKNPYDREARDLLKSFAHTQYRSVFHRQASTKDDAYISVPAGFKLNALQSKIVVDLINNEGEPLRQWFENQQSKSAKKRGEPVPSAMTIWMNNFHYNLEHPILFSEALL